MCICVRVYDVIDKELSGRQIVGLVWNAFLPRPSTDVCVCVFVCCVWMLLEQETGWGTLEGITKEVRAQWVMTHLVT